MEVSRCGCLLLIYEGANVLLRAVVVLQRNGRRCTEGCDTRVLGLIIGRKSGDVQDCEG